MKKTGYSKLIIIVVCVLILCAVIPTGIFRLVDHYNMNKQERMDRQPIESTDASLSIFEKIEMLQNIENTENDVSIQVLGEKDEFEYGIEDTSEVSDAKKAIRETALNELRLLFAPWEDQWAQFSNENIIWEDQETVILVDFQSKKSFYVEVLMFHLEEKNIQCTIFLDEDTGKILGLIIQAPEELKAKLFENNIKIDTAYDLEQIEAGNPELYNWLLYERKVASNLAQMYSDYLGEPLDYCIEDSSLYLYSNDKKISFVSCWARDITYALKINMK